MEYYRYHKEFDNFNRPYCMWKPHIWNKKNQGNNSLSTISNYTVRNILGRFFSIVTGTTVATTVTVITATSQLHYTEPLIQAASVISIHTVYHVIIKIFLKVYDMVNSSLHVKQSCIKKLNSLYSVTLFKCTGKRSAFIPIPKKGYTKKCSNYHTVL